MRQKHLNFISAGFMGGTLFLTLFLINKFYNIRLYLVIAFVILNIVKDIVLNKMGYTFKGVGIKIMMIYYCIILIVIFCLAWLNVI